MNTTFLSIEGSYSNLELELFQSQKFIQKNFDNNLKASSTLILKIDSLLKQNKISLSDLDFIAVNQGPGAFTSLRVVISTVNSISFSTKIPLIGIDGLDALSLQALKKLDNKEKPSIIISLLNAYSNEVYFSVNKVIEKKLEKIKPNGYKKINLFFDEIRLIRQAPAYAKVSAGKQGKRGKDQRILFTGNGAILHKELILEKLGNNAIFAEKILETASSTQIGIMALEKYNQQEQKIYKLKPLYLKSQAFATKK